MVSEGEIVVLISALGYVIVPHLKTKMVFTSKLRLL